MIRRWPICSLSYTFFAIHLRGPHCQPSSIACAAAIRCSKLSRSALLFAVTFELRGTKIMDTQQLRAKAQFESQSFFLLRNLPKGSEFGFDGKIFVVDKFEVNDFSLV